MEKQEKLQKRDRIPGLVRIVTLKTGYAEHYVSRVLNGRVNRAGKKARVIVEMAEKIKSSLEGI